MGIDGEMQPRVINPVIDRTAWACGAPHLDTLSLLRRGATVLVKSDDAFIQSIYLLSGSEED